MKGTFRDWDEPPFPNRHWHVAAADVPLSRNRRVRHVRAQTDRIAILYRTAHLRLRLPARARGLRLRQRAAGSSRRVDGR